MDTTLTASESLSIRTTVTNQDGTVRDLTDATATFVIWDSPSKNGEPVLVGTSMVMDEEGGIVESYLSAGEFEGLHVYYGEVTLTESDGTVTVIESGKIKVQA